MAIESGTRSCTVVLHDDSVSRKEFLCGANVLSTGQIGYLTGPSGKALCIHAEEAAQNAGEVSIHVSVAKLFGFENRVKATIRLVEDVEAATAAHVELLFRDQHLSRADMWRIQAQIDGSVLYKGQRLKYLDSTVATVEAIYIAGQEVDSAIVQHPNSKLIYRSASAQYTMLIQISKELLEQWQDGNLNYEVLLDGFLPELFRRWDRLKVRHLITVVLFGRNSTSANWLDSEAVDADHQRIGREAAEDFCYVIALDLPSSSWRELLRKLKSAFNGTQLPRQVSLAADGNMLEAIYLTALDFADDSVDQHLASTGTSIIAITAGAGMFKAKYETLKSTTDLLIGNSIGADIVSLAPKPLHPVPLFQYERDGSVEYALPHWLDISYWDSRSEAHKIAWLLGDPLEDVNDVAMPGLSEPKIAASSDSLMHRLDAFDDDLFSCATGEVDAVNRMHSPSTHGKQPIAAIKEQSPVQDEPLANFRSLDKPLGSVMNGTSETVQTPSQASTPLAQRAKREALPPHALMQTNRKISLGPKGLALSQGVASTTVSAHHAQHERETAKATVSTAAEVSSGLAMQIRESLRHKPSQSTLATRPTSEMNDTSRPIDIHAQDGKKTAAPEDPASVVEKGVMERAGHSGPGSSLSATPRADGGPLSVTESSSIEDEIRTACPWLTLLNPCNPRRDNMRVASEYRKWQNVFPRAVSSAAFKWDSICTPAALPLMIEVRISLTELERRFNKKVRRLATAKVGAPTTNPAHQALLQMTATRLSAGYQIVPLRKFPHSQLAHEHIDRMLLSLGSTYHELRCVSNFEVQVTEYNRQLDSSTSSDLIDSSLGGYRFNVIPTISSREQSVEINLRPHGPYIDWSGLDDQCVKSAALSNDVGVCRMRLVLIPIDLPRTESNAGLRALSDEETRLDGIQRLTQVWQRNRYFSEEEQRHQAAMIKSKTSGTVERDPNPLAIEYITRDLSVVTNAYGSTLAGQLSIGEVHGKLFAESEQYHSSNFDIDKLVKQMQVPPPSGVELRDRRWFTLLHYKCFRGDEMTNWLLRVFKDLQTRKDAVDLGNQLMDRDIFTHVRGKHEFRDGNYFYQIRSTHRTTDYPDTTSFFGKAIGRSVPSTPIAELKQSPAMRAVQNDSDSSSSGSPTLAVPFTGKREAKELLLSQKLQYNVDAARKSKQLEVINIHYDCIHNPDNCYHFQLDWTSATPKLIHDSLMRWSALVESHGLKLVQLPLKEACKVHEQHPFDRTLPVKLAIRPPAKVLTTPHLDAQSLSPRVTGDAHGYHKAVLRKSGFVLDLESGGSFSRNLDVTYSWGRPEYEYTQFVHKTGLLLAQISSIDQSDFLLLPNPLAPYPGVGTGKRTEPFTAESIANDFVSFCRDEQRLKITFEELAKTSLSDPSPFANPTLTADHDVPQMELPPHLMHRAALRNIS